MPASPLPLPPPSATPVPAPPSPASKRLQRRLRRDAVLAVRPRWRETLALGLTAVIVASVPVAAISALQAGRRMDEAEAAATTLAELAPRAEQVSTTTAEVARRLAVIAETQGPLLEDVARGVDGVMADIDEMAGVLEPVAGAIGRLAPVVRVFGGDEAGDSLARAQATLIEVDRAVENVAGATADVADQVALLTSPETIAVLEQAADSIDTVADLSRTAGSLAEGYVDRAGTYRLLAQLVAVVGLLGTVAWLAWRIREHRRWLVLRRRGVAPRVLGAVASGSITA